MRPSSVAHSNFDSTTLICAINVLEQVRTLITTSSDMFKTTGDATEKLTFDTRSIIH
ncbi:hypothetical protein M404DRAFT_28037 [Pisolithus tinctorius Marx 270]|uniref:Uncharacterized protein n=1 Tax=Pisolithus tinctorius Marx 270 TaxID=870435 RepID=A0A0C3NMB6_PISTI|nr:hypothetical protein M404DRAFT_28037 [Pisolithus tinctorius Marx 270]